jgi:hypothetical protein
LVIYPRLGDFAVLGYRLSGADQYDESVVQAGIFDESWKLPADPPQP